MSYGCQIRADAPRMYIRYINTVYPRGVYTNLDADVNRRHREFQLFVTSGTPGDASDVPCVLQTVPVFCNVVLGHHSKLQSFVNHPMNLKFYVAEDYKHNGT